ncbi:acetate/propionate family kinase [Tropicibacter oceani]|uniref:Acetate kinase n=1 Tax=Tropicibacter oceani TaxID=3058420 RepID=A0ABY8QJW4_9RHOB|nr:acetate/propionate family kinase [Tropicibacter oceani]WGW04442.1 acetate/propionate family kinase [Tropicibacter oceani]
MMLVVNAGSSSIKTQLFDAQLTSVLSVDVTGIGGTAQLRVGADRTPAVAPDHDKALRLILRALTDHGHPVAEITAAGHRVVHGGSLLVRPVRITPEVIGQIRACIPLAPLHNPHNLSAIEALTRIAPDIAQYASFDTAFHATNPPEAALYPLPDAQRDKGLRRYGFHGLSYAAMVRRFGDALPPRLLACHLGNGASLCAIRDGRSVATTMGYSPMAGLPMGTRVGDIDGSAVLRLAREIGIDQTESLLNGQSGLVALAGTNDMAELLASDRPEAGFAVNYFCYWVARHAGSMIAAMQGLDAIAFTGGIGENAAPVRDKVLAHLAWAGKVPVHVVPAGEERQIALDALGLGARI